MFQRIKWFLRGKPVKKVLGGWCGLCGDWLPNEEFTFPDYWVVDNLFDLNSICPNGCKPHKTLTKGLSHLTTDACCKG